jgi:dimethylhistidine N-methyltransferase
MQTTSLQTSQNSLSAKEQFAIDVLMGLSSKPKSLSAKYFYDDMGSDLFQKITQHEDYYLTRTEYEIISKSKDLIPKFIAENEIDIIELGAGDGHKSQLVINGFLEQDKKVNFFPIDISAEAMKQLEKTIQPHANLSIHGVIAEYLDGLRFVRNKSRNKQLVLFLGSNIGNFDRVQNQGFLRRLWKNLNAEDYVLIGFDLKKAIKKLTAAYNDAAGITRKFNLNLLDRINNELGANFNSSQFDHFGSYNPILGAMESYLLPIAPQEVYIEEIQRSFSFKAYEPIHLEYSFKFLPSDIEQLAKQTGFEITKHFTDKNNYFIDSLWQVKKSSL